MAKLGTGTPLQGHAVRIEVHYGRKIIGEPHLGSKRGFVVGEVVDERRIVRKIDVRDPKGNQGRCKEREEVVDMLMDDQIDCRKIIGHAHVPYGNVYIEMGGSSSPKDEG
ncbi:hypothetical protein B0H14DRAFT_3132916 [Mycena olivaceomarginata]|nr:hypothetical protein B0H14DRAFT_3132916 [Mycena olivaceomarginata]